MASHAYTASCVINYFHIIERWDEKKRNQPENYLQGRTLAWYNLQRYTMYAGDTRMFYIRHELLSSEHTTLSSRDVLQKVKLNFIVHLVTILKFIEVLPWKLYLRMSKLDLSLPLPKLVFFPTLVKFLLNEFIFRISFFRGFFFNALHAAIIIWNINSIVITSSPILHFALDTFFCVANSMKHETRKW